MTRRLDPKEVHELPDGDAARAAGNRLGRGDVGGYSRPLQQEGGQHVPRVGDFSEPGQRCLQLRPRGPPRLAQDRRVDPRPPGWGLAVLRVPQGSDDRPDITEGQRKLRQGAGPDDAHSSGIHQQGQDRKQVLDLGPLE